MTNFFWGKYDQFSYYSTTRLTTIIQQKNKLFVYVWRGSLAPGTIWRNSIFVLHVWFRVAERDQKWQIKEKMQDTKNT